MTGDGEQERGKRREERNWEIGNKREEKRDGGREEEIFVWKD